MDEKEQLQVEIRNHLIEVGGSTYQYKNFLDTIAKFHKYSIIEQINLHYHAPSEASAVAPDYVWKNSFRTTLRDGAVAIPLLVTQDNEQYDVRYVYDMRDTLAYQNSEAALQGIPWKFSPEYENLVKSALDSASAQSIDAAIRAKVVELTTAQNTAHDDFITASVEYIVRSRLGLSNQTTFPEEMSIPQDVHIAVILGEVNQISRTILDSIGKVITVANRENAAKKEAVSNENDRRNDPEISLWDMGRYEKGVPQKDAARGVAANAGGRNTGSVPARVRRNDVREVGADDRGNLPAGQRDRGTQEARRDAVDPQVQQRSGRGAGTSDGRDHAGSPRSLSVGGFSITIPETLQSESANKIFADLQTAREEGQITSAQARGIYLSFVRELMSAEALTTKEQDALIGRAYYEVAATYTSPIVIQQSARKEQVEPVRSLQEETIPKEAPVSKEDTALSMNSSIKTWYLEKYPNDQSGTYLEDITFQELTDALPMGSELYAYAGIDSSDVRERLFIQLAELSERPYDDILSVWTDSPSADLVKEHLEETVNAPENIPMDSSTIETDPPSEIHEIEETVRPVYEAEMVDPQTIEVPASEDHIEINVPPTIDAEFTEVDLSKLDLSADMSTMAGKRAVFERNMAAIQIANHLERTGNLPNEQELEVLRSYSGFGGISEAFDARNTTWHNEYVRAKEVMTEPEYLSARTSTLDAFYTPPEIVQAIYQGLEKAGFREGNILDPSTGTGRFLHHMSEDMKERSHRVGIELDTLTAKIARYATDGAVILNNGFERTNFPQNAFDLAISNVPFGNYIITDSNYDGNYFVHDYFLKKMMDQVRPGGLVVAITSHGTMDKKDDTLRRELAQKGELIRAVRLPNKLFAGAGTDVLSDLLIFRKREKELAPNAEMPAWVNADLQEFVYFDNGKRVEDGYHLNRYFVENPTDILGTLSARNRAFGVEPYVEGDDRGIKALADELSAVLSGIPTNSYQPLPVALPVPQEIERPSNNQPFGFYEQNGSLVYYTPQGKIEAKGFDKKNEQKIRSAIRIRDVIREMFDAETYGCSDTELAQFQDKLNQLYEEHTKKYGRIHQDKSFRRVFSMDASYPILLSLEIVENDEYIGRSDVFSKRTIHAYSAPDHAETPGEALMISMQEKGHVDIPYMAKLTGMSAEDVVRDLEYTSIFEDMETNSYLPADEYLSGDVRARMEALEKQIQKWQQEMEDVVKEQAFPVPKDFPYRLSGRNLPLEKMARWNAIGFLSDEDKKTLFRGENREAFYYVLKHSSEQFQKEYLRFLGENAPEAGAALNDPMFYLECLRNNVMFDFDVNETHRIFSKTLASLGLDHRDLTEEATEIKMMGFLYQTFSDYQRGAHPEVLEPQRLVSALQEHLRTYDEKIEITRNGDDNPLISYLRDEIQRACKNLEALEKVKPKDLTADEIKINLGATWIPTEDIEQFIRDVLEYRGTNRLVQYAASTGEWKVEHNSGDAYRSNQVKMYSTFGTKDTNALAILEAALNHRQIRIRNDKGVVLEEASLLVAQKMDNLRDEFLKWVYRDEERKMRLVSYYNRHFNNIVPREFDGSRLTFPGMNPEIELKQHQKDAVAHTLYGGNTLLAHVVGAGKTFEMQASAMESKRIGLCKKSLMIMPGHLTEQFGAEFLRLYPNAKILVATPKDFQKDKRAEFCAKITGQDWDAVVMSYEQFGKIPLSLERQEQFLKREIQELTDSLEALKIAKEGRGFSVKQMEKQIKKLKKQYESVMEAYQSRQDATITFEQLGIDRLYVDEAHFYKNLSFTTKIQGLNATGAEKSTDLLAKIQYLNEITNERGVVFATGTPLSNSMAELYTLQRYLRPSRLEKQGLYHFDAWASAFGQETTTMEIDPAGKGFRAKTRFARFNNIPELMSMFKEFADVRTAESLKLPVPEYDINIIKAEASPLQKELVDRLAERAKRIRQRKPIRLREDADESSGKGMDNMLVVVKEGQSAALDPRIIDPSYPDNPDGKVNLCVNNVYDIYKETMDKKSTQVIFCDQSTPNTKAPFTVYGDIRDKLMGKGVPKDQIAFIHDYDTPEKKEALFTRVRKGEVRILLGSSDKLGVGTNIQDKLIASHDLDCPWKPSQIEQRFGRIVRRGNENEKVKVFRYVTDATFDSYMWQTNETKQRFISQVMTNRTPVREADDVDEFTMTYAQLKAACTGNPLYKEQFELRSDLQKLGAERAQYLEDQSRLNNRLNVGLPAYIKTAEGFLQNMRKDIDTLNQNVDDKSLVLGGVTYKTPKEIGEVLADCARAIYDGKLKETPRGRYRGMKISIVQNEQHKIDVIMSGMTTTSFRIGATTPEENATRLEDAPRTVFEKLPSAEAEVKRLYQEVEDCKEGLGKPFPKEEEYKEKTLRFNEVNLLIEEQNKQEDQQVTKTLEAKQEEAIAR